MGTNTVLSCKDDSIEEKDDLSFKSKLDYTPPQLILLSSDTDIQGGVLSLQEADPNGGALS
jgi:hypothetical protein